MGRERRGGRGRLDTLEVEVKRAIAVADVGRAVHPVLVEGQLQGGTLQALGWGHLEQLVVRGGRVANPRMTDYVIPTTLDTPDIETIIVERPYARGPWGAKGVGELPMDGPAAALAAAVSQALGVFVDTIPATPERLLLLVEGAPMISFTLNGRPVTVEAPALSRLIDVLRGELALTGTKEGCRRGRVRRLLGPRRRTGGRVLSRARLPGGGVPRRDDRGSRRGRRARRAAACVPRARRRPVRDLHARDAGRGQGVAGRQDGAVTGGGPCRARRQPVPLHRVHEDRRA